MAEQITVSTKTEETAQMMALFMAVERIYYVPCHTASKFAFRVRWLTGADSLAAMLPGETKSVSRYNITKT